MPVTDPTGATLAVDPTLAVDATQAALVLALPAPAQPPVQYSWWVWALGLALLLAIAAWYWWLVRATRPKAPGASTEQVAAARAEHLALVAEARDRYRGGESDLRGLHLDLNYAIRSFATARTGVDASSLTVAELTRVEHGSALALVLQGYSEPAFAAVSDAEAEAAVAQAQEVIRTW